VGFLWRDFRKFSIPFISGATPFSISAAPINLNVAGGLETGVQPGRSEADADGFASIILSPYRITVSDGGRNTQGSQKTHYQVPRRSDLFYSLNARCRAFFEDVVFTTPEPGEIQAGRWGDLVSERGILFEYRAPIPQDIVKWLVRRGASATGATGAPAEIEKILILPEENAGRQSVCLYVLSGDSIYRVFTQSVSYTDMQRLINDSLSILSDGVSYITINEIGGGRFPGFSPDVFCIVEGPKTNDFRRIKHTAPAAVRDKSELENIILSSDIYSYSRTVDINDTIVFKNITSIYRIYSDGLMEYNYIPLTLPADKGGVAAAMENAAAYILNIERQLLGGADLVLSGIYADESELSYRFTFDYIADDFPVYFRYEQAPGDTAGGYQNAITITANANRTLSCRWMLVDLFFASETKKLQVYFDRIEVGQSLTKMDVSDIAIAYVVDLTPETADARPGGNATFGGERKTYDEWPVWAITSPDGAIETVRLAGT